MHTQNISLAGWNYKYLATIGRCKITSFYNDDQNPSGFFFPVQIRAFVINLAGITKFEYERKTKRFLVVVVK